MHDTTNETDSMWQGASYQCASPANNCSEQAGKQAGKQAGEQANASAPANGCEPDQAEHAPSTINHVSHFDRYT
jgi:hypothetical protein